MRRLLQLLLVLGTMGLGCANNDPAGVSFGNRDESALNVLFIGNSLTYWNDLPAIVGALADSAKVKPLNWVQVAFPDFALEDHWAQGTALSALRSRTWDVVVLQQGPSSLPENRANLIEWSKRFDAEIRKAGGKPALYMVWPQINRQQDFDNASMSYQLAAESVKGMLFPVGEAWRAAWRRNNTLPLYSGDGLHPNVNGSYIAALVMFQLLYDKTPVGLPARLRLGVQGSPVLEVSPATADILQASAVEANTQFGKR
jgi:hypothetical protein